VKQASAKESDVNYSKMIETAMARTPDKAVARGLGIASIAIGLTELAAPKKLEKMMGVGNGRTTNILRVLGVREIMHGVDILSHEDPTPGVWARVAGDALDGALLGMAATKTRRPGGLMSVFALVLPIVLFDIIFATRLSRDEDQDA
jgi:hypothetical protein